jgi:hypothetical protein
VEAVASAEAQMPQPCAQSIEKYAFYVGKGINSSDSCVVGDI